MRHRYGLALAVCVVTTMDASLALAQKGLLADLGPRAMGTSQSTASMRGPSDQPTARTERERVSITLKDSTVEYAVRAVAGQAHLRVVFDNGAPLTKKRVTVRIANANPLAAFAEILQGTGFAAKLAPDGETVVIRAAGRNQSGGTIKGRVVDSASRKGISRVSVSVDGMRGSVLTNSDGQFTIAGVPAGDQVVVVKLLGYTPVRRTVRVTDNGDATLAVTLVPTATLLSGVVTTATGRQRKLEVGNDITTLNVDSIFKTAPITSVTDLLAARVPGLTMQRTTGTPGDPARIRLRGTGSITGNNDPIIVVDGIRMYSAQSDTRSANLINEKSTKEYPAPSPLDQIDPNSIATIEVLKGPSASALYGSDAANGVIVITTKRGEAGPGRWNASVSQGLSYMPGSWPVNQFQFGTSLTGKGSLDEAFGGTHECGVFDFTCTLDSIVAFQALNDSRTTVLGHGHDTQASVTVSGGSADIQYSLTGSQGRTLGILQTPASDLDLYQSIHGFSAPSWMERPDRYDTWGASGRLTVQVNSRMNVALTSSLNHGNQARSSLDAVISKLQGQYFDVSQIQGTPIVQDFAQKVSDENMTSTNAVQVGWQPVTWLPLSGTVGISTGNRTDVELLMNGDSPGTLDSLGHYFSGKGTTTDKTAGVNAEIPLLKYLRVATGISYHTTTTSDVNAYAYGLAPGATSVANLAAGDSQFGYASNGFTQNQTTQTSFGWFIEPRLNLSSRLFIMPGFRLDGNGSSGSASKLTGFPKTNVSWIVSDESFFPFKNIFNSLRLRGAFGYAGVQPNPGDQLRLLSPDSSATGIYTGATPITALGNTHLRPEKSEEIEGGFDAEILDGRVTAQVTLYNKTRHDAILLIPVAPSVYGGGYAQIFTNIGVVRNTGSEISLSAQLLTLPQFGWQVQTGMSRNHNKVIRLNPGQDNIHTDDGSPGAELRVTPGYPINSRWARPILGYADANNDKIIEASEVVLGDSMVYIGALDPNYTLNASSNWTLLRGRLTVNTLFSYTNGMTQMDQVAALAAVLGTTSTAHSPYSSLVGNPNVPLGIQAAAVAPTAYGVTQTVSTLRFQSMSINYNFGTSVTRLFRSRSLALSLQGNNLGLRTNYHSKDPDVNVHSSGNYTLDGGQLPQPRTWSLRISVGI